MTQRLLQTVTFALAAIVLASATLSAQVPPVTQKPPVTSSQGRPVLPSPPPPVEPNYIIGANDVLTINVWNEKELSGDVIVRPDGKITLPVGAEIMALGLRPDELKKKIMEELGNFYKPAPEVYIQVKQINSRMVFITGSVARPGPYPVIGSMTMVQLIATAGGLAEFADRKNIMLISATLKDKSGQPLAYKINYDDLMKGRNLAKNNIELRPGDQVIVR